MIRCIKPFAFRVNVPGGGWGGGKVCTPCNGLYREALPEGEGFSQVELYESGMEICHFNL